jgi:hypothetical protein
MKSSDSEIEGQTPEGETCEVAKVLTILKVSAQAEDGKDAGENVQGDDGADGAEDVGFEQPRGAEAHWIYRWVEDRHDSRRPLEAGRRSQKDGKGMLCPSRSKGELTSLSGYG